MQGKDAEEGWILLHVAPSFPTPFVALDLYQLQGSKVILAEWEVYGGKGDNNSAFPSEASRSPFPAGFSAHLCRSIELNSKSG